MISTRHIVAFIITISFLGCITNRESIGIKKFDWLLGNWRMVDSTGLTTESWQNGIGTSMYGKSFMGKNDSTLKPFETVVIQKTGTSYTYTVTSANPNDTVPIVFTITTFTANSFVAENKQHDYPKRIAYKQIGKDSLQAFIDDGEENSKQRFYFNYSSVK